MHYISKHVINFGPTDLKASSLITFQVSDEFATALARTVFFLILRPFTRIISRKNHASVCSSTTKSELTHSQQMRSGSQQIFQVHITNNSRALNAESELSVVTVVSTATCPAPEPNRHIAIPHATPTTVLDKDLRQPAAIDRIASHTRPFCHACNHRATNGTTP